MQKIKTFYATHKQYLPAAFFIGGFLFDIITLGRVDNVYAIIQQGLYIIILVKLLELRARESIGRFSPPQYLLKGWGYQNEAFHFILGSLLSSYTLFYFVSSSLSTSLLFLIFMAAVLVANELPALQQKDLSVKSSLLLFCQISFFSIMIPIIVGSVGTLTFIASIILSGLSTWLFAKKLLAHGFTHENLKIKLYYPHAGIAAALVLLYGLKILPPIPVSIQYMGIYHGVTREENSFVLKYDRSWWRFWQNGAETFVAQPGDQIYCFARVFSPSTFSDHVIFHWQYKTSNGWESSDRVKISIRGGRDDGYRGYAVKSNYHPGDWRVSVETQDGREIGRIDFEVQTSVQSAREFRVDRF